MELRAKVALAIERADNVHVEDGYADGVTGKPALRHDEISDWGAWLADAVLEVPEIREALSLKHSLETALRVNGSFHVTDENLKASGNSWA